MRKVLLSAVFVLCGFGVSSLRAQEIVPAPEQYKLRMEYMKFAPTLDAQVERGDAGASGSRLDAKGDLNLVDHRTQEFHGALQIAQGHKVRGSYMRLDYKGDTTANRTFNYGGTTYPATTKVVTLLKAGYYSADYQFDVVKRDTGIFGFIVGGKYVNGDSQISAPDLQRTEADTRSVVVPIAGVTGRLYLGRLSLGGEFSGITLGKRGHLYDFFASGQIHLSDRLALGGGYHRLILHGAAAPDVLDVRLGGWRFGVEISL
jgi:hypothetical protein